MLPQKLSNLNQDLTSEIRGPPSAVAPKRTTILVRVLRDRLGLGEAGARECNEPELRLESLDWLRSGFGLRISFGFRASDFEL